MIEALKKTATGSARVQNAERRQTERIARNLERQDQTQGQGDHEERRDRARVQDDREARLDHSEPGGAQM